MAKGAKGVKKRYEVFMEKYKLPSFEELDSEFEISAIDSESFLLREVRARVSDKVGEVGSLVEAVLHPETNLVDLYESRIFDEQEKNELFELYKKLMAADRNLAELSVLNDEELDAAFIKSFSAEWKKLKPELVKFIRKLREAWEKETDEREVAGYMG